MAQIEHYTGKLGFDSRSEEKLPLALNALLETLEEFGHPAEQINARDPHKVVLECDHYQIALRWRSVPLRLGMGLARGGRPCAATIELGLTPLHPEAVDREISEIILAVALKEMTEVLEPMCLYWKGESAQISPKDFLKAFEAPRPAEQTAPMVSKVKANKEQSQHPERAQLSQGPQLEPEVLAEPAFATGATQHGAAQQAPSQALSLSETSQERRLRLADRARAEAEAERARGTACFGSAEAALPHIEEECDRISKAPTDSASHVRAAKAIAKPIAATLATSYQSQQMQLRQAMLRQSPLRSLVSGLSQTLRGADLVMSLRALVTAVVILFLHGSGMVQAAAKAFLP